MRTFKMLGACASMLALSACATSYSVTPTDLGSAKLSYNQGRATTDLDQARGAVKVTPLGVAENGRLNFAVAAINKAGEPVTFGSENFTATVGGVPVQVFTYAQLEKQAKTAAAWATFAVALSGAASAYSANQNAYRTSSSALYTPRGTYYATSTTYDPLAAQLGTAAAGAATAGGIYAINKQLDDTLNRLGGSILQTTTIAPGQSYGGQIVVAKPKSSAPYTVDVVAHLNGEDFPFHFTIAQIQ